MLQPETPYPYVGSYALIELDGATQLARIQMRREGEVVISLPFRAGAAGNLRVDPAALIDGTPLSDDEAGEWRDFNRHLAGRVARTKRQKAIKARAEALRARAMIYAPLMKRLLTDLRQRDSLRRAA